MTSTSDSIFLGEFRYISKPPYFNSANYFYWKARMMFFIQVNDLVIWGIIMDGPSIPLKQEGKLLVPKRKKEWNEEDKKKVTHKGTSQVKKSKVGILTLNYEMLEMKLEEDIKAMSDRSTIIINGLKSYGKTYPNEEVVWKMLRSLPKSWEAKLQPKRKQLNNPLGTILGILPSVLL
ncbi:hypothetical protein PVK06_004757 [Gossypium arboreum]|uniref:DUF4219 domain-containing protein n=1 Tax=Gossypium arboreum TaxID=29729 RepID=A0ABR0QT27_GOSAR|nr:hypothetical protein PVK06_004757 [Gossypium arboreum]